MYEKFPEAMFVDATYKLLELRITLYLFLIIDGDGLSKIVGMAIMAEEMKNVMQASVGVFKKHNPASQHKRYYGRQEFH